jgi:glycosyltransferase involved in cell wall biosynthesis
MDDAKSRICYIGDCRSVHFQRWVNYFKERYDICVISPSSCSHDGCLQLEEFVPDRWKWLSAFPKLGFFVRAYFLNLYFRNTKTDLVHIHYLGDYATKVGLSIILFPLRRLFPIVISTWGADIVGLHGMRTILLRRLILHNSDLVTATSHFLARETRKLAPKIKWLEIVPFGVDLDLFDPEEYLWKNRTNSSLRIGFFKHLKKKYGPEYLIKAFEQIVKNNNNVELFLAGEGELEDELKDLAKMLGVFEKIHFLGFVENVPEVMASMEITVMPSVEESETFGVAALESQALKIPVVATWVGGVPETVRDGVTGFMVPPRDEILLAEAMNKLLSDKNLRTKMGKSGRRFVMENYDWFKNAGMMGNLYEELLNKQSFIEINGISR